MENQVTILGARGSTPVSGGAFSRFGGATTCVLVRLDGQTVILDAGTGLLNLPANALAEETLPLLLTHAHADHLLGLAMCPYLMRKGRRLDLYAAERNGLDAEAQVRRLLSPPLWPVGPESLPGVLRCRSLPDDLSFGDVRIETTEGVHPGGVTLFRLSGGGRRVVFASDCTLTAELLPRLTEFARDCDLLLIDGQFSEQEWPTHAGYGHSTWTAAARFGRACGAKQVRVVHHAPTRTDAELDAAAPELSAIHPQCGFAYEGEEIRL